MDQPLETYKDFLQFFEKGIENKYWKSIVSLDKIILILTVFSSCSRAWGWKFSAKPFKVTKQYLGSYCR